MSKRTFIAINIEASEDFLDVFYDIKDNLKKQNIKWINPKQIHLTLKFIGDTKEYLVEEIISCIKESFNNTDSFHIQLNALGYFGKKNDPKVLWVGIEECKKLIKCHEILNKNLSKIGIAKENRKFSPHLTLGRIKGLSDINSFNEIIEDYKHEIDERILISEITYFESKLTPKGPIYKSLYNKKLGI